MIGPRDAFANSARLMHCLEAHYGDLSTAIAQPDEELRLLRELASLTERYRI